MEARGVRPLTRIFVTGLDPCLRRYLVLPGFYDQAETQEMLDRAQKLCDEFSIEGHPMVHLS